MFLLAAGCDSLRAHDDVPAILVDPTPEVRAELGDVVAGALHGVPVTLADDALTRESILTLERAAARNANGVRVQGRERGRPEKFRLVKNGSDCVLVHEGSRQRWKLATATCQPSS